MTNREYLDSLSNMDFANFIYSKLLKIGKEYKIVLVGLNKKKTINIIY